ncbi:N-acetylneuraminate synthase family protein [Candidatus Pelagibacter bacterium]|jgi:sialic acid synthase SpsE|nr:N-acetylneuraminate synthase family protein [Candidatus Pelagibacter bacterium]
MRKKVEFGSKKIGDNERVPFIAEIGVNHLGKISSALELVESAVRAGSDFLKFQTYIAEERYDKNNPRYKEFTSLLKEWELSRDEQIEMWNLAKSLGAEVFTSVYELKSIEFAEKMGTVGYKIAAFEMKNKPLLKEVFKTKKPIIISCGMTNLDEINELVNFLNENNAKYILLHVVSSYPLEERHSYLSKINILKQKFDCPIGHSDHTQGTLIPPLAVAAGAQIIEKHFTINPKYRLSDNFFSVTEEQVKKIKLELEWAFQATYSPSFKKSDPEKFMRDFKKNIS